MSMSTHVVGFKPPDAKWQRMKAVWDACDHAGVPPPPEVMAFFDGEEPDVNGVEVTEDALIRCGALREWHDDGRDGYEVLVEKLPADVKVIRFYNSW